MKLDKVEIVNYRSIKKETITFDPTCRVLVGINESGKSNILKALRLLSEDYDPIRKDDVRESLPEEDEIEEAYVKFFLRLEKSETEEMFNQISGKVLSAVKDPEIVTVNGVVTSLKTFCNQRTGVRYHVDLIAESKACRYTTFEQSIVLNGEWKKPTKTCPPDFEVEVKGQKVKLGSYIFVRVSDFPDIPPDYLEDVQMVNVASLFGNISNKITEENLLEALYWEYDESNLLPSQIGIDEFATKPGACIPLRNMFSLAGVTDVKTEIDRVKALSNNQIQNFLDRIASKTTSHFRSVWKEYRTIEFKLRLDANKIIPAIKEQNSFDFSKRSDGFKRFVTFLLMISVNVKTDDLKNTLLLIDEPDSSLHPSGARYLRDELIRISSKNYVLYSTHSIFMIDAGNIGRHYIVKKKDEITSVESAKDSNIADEEVLFNALGYSVFEILNAKNIVFEGWKDKKIFLTALDKSSADLKKAFKDVGICHAKGAKHIKAITPLMELANRSCVIVSDSDAAAKEQQKLYKQSKGFGEWKTYQDIDSKLQAITGEDFIKNSHITKQVNLAISGFGLPVFTESNLPADKEKLKAIEVWLKASSLTDEQIKDTVNKIKDLIFDNLTSKDIEDFYEMLMKGIASLL
jgi:predicted ATP-dependent endonuclease of OLD family